MESDETFSVQLSAPSAGLTIGDGVGLGTIANDDQAPNQLPVAVVTATAKLAPEAEIIAALAASLAKFKVPKRIFEVAELPRNAMGKVQKNVLRETYAGKASG